LRAMGILHRGPPILAVPTAAAVQASPRVRLLACAAQERDRMGMVLPPIDRPHHDRAVETARAALGEVPFAAALAEGKRWISTR
jgi:hypothetical protein